MSYKSKIGVLVMALLEDDYNKTAHVRPMAQKAADRIGGILAAYGETVCPPLVEEEHQAEAAAQMFNATGVDLIVAVEVAYTKGIVPVRCFLSTTAPVVVWNTQQIRFLPEEAAFRPDHGQLGHVRRAGDDLRSATPGTERGGERGGEQQGGYGAHLPR